MYFSERNHGTDQHTKSDPIENLDELGQNGGIHRREQLDVKQYSYGKGPSMH